VRKIERFTVGDLIATLQEFDASLPVGVVTFDENDLGHGPYYEIRPELYVSPQGPTRMTYLGITGYAHEGDGNE